MRLDSDGVLQFLGASVFAALLVGLLLGCAGIPAPEPFVTEDITPHLRVVACPAATVEVVREAAQAWEAACKAPLFAGAAGETSLYCVSRGEVAGASGNPYFVAVTFSGAPGASRQPRRHSILVATADEPPAQVYWSVYHELGHVLLGGSHTPEGTDDASFMHAAYDGKARKAPSERDGMICRQRWMS